MKYKKTVFYGIIKYIYAFMGVVFLKIKSTRYLIGQIITGALILALLCTIVIPSLSRCFENADIKKCTRDMKNIMNTFEKVLNTGNDADKWKELLSQKKSQQLLAEIVPLMPPEQQVLDTQDYYFENDGDTLRILCKNHDKIEEDISFVLPDAYSFNAEAPDVSKAVDTLIVSGIKNYAKGTALDAANPEKMKFGAEENLNSLFPSIDVYSVNVISKSALLSREDYIITAGGEDIDMSVPGTKQLKISYKSNNSVWANNISTMFSFEVLEKTDCPPIQARFKNAKYDIEAWNWNDFVTALSKSSEQRKNFGAALIYFNTHYYYYPDGFAVDKSQDNSSPLNSAFDKDAPAITAHYIEVFGEKTVSANAEDIAAGALTAINDDIYAYRKKTRAQDGGWVRIYANAVKAPIPTAKPRYYDDED